VTKSIQLTRNIVGLKGCVSQRTKLSNNNNTA